MIGVLTASTTSGNVLGYDLGDLKSKKQRIQILGFAGVFVDVSQIDRLNQNWTDDASLEEFKRVSRAVANDLAEQFDAQASVNDRVVRTTGHISLSFSPEDRPLLTDNDFKVQLAEEYMQKMGIVDTQWVITEHYDTHCPHLHIAYNRVKFDGTVIRSSNERYRSQKVAAEISKKYGLTPAGAAPRKNDNLCEKRKKYAELRTDVMEILSKSSTLEEFQNNLFEEKEIELQISKHAGTETNYGVSFKRDEISAKGSKLDRTALSYSKVVEILETQRRAAELEAQQERVRKQQEAQMREQARNQKEQLRAKAKAKKIMIQNYIESPDAKTLLAIINEAFGTFSSHYHLVPGRIEERENGVVRLWLDEDGYTDNKKIYLPHSPIPQKYGESYADFTFNEKGQLVATVEADPKDYYSIGVSGQFNIVTQETTIKQRKYFGSKQVEETERERQNASEKVLWQSGRSGIDCRIIQNREGKYELQEGQPGGKIVNGRYSEMIWRTTKRFSRFNKIAQKGDNDYFSIIKQDNSRAIIDNHGNEISQTELQRLGISGHGYNGPRL